MYQPLRIVSCALPHAGPRFEAESAAHFWSKRLRPGQYSIDVLVGEAENLCSLSLRRATGRIEPFPQRFQDFAIGISLHATNLAISRNFVKFFLDTEYALGLELVKWRKDHAESI